MKEKGMLLLPRGPTFRSTETRVDQMLEPSSLNGESAKWQLVRFVSGKDSYISKFIWNKHETSKRTDIQQQRDESWPNAETIFCERGERQVAAFVLFRGKVLIWASSYGTSRKLQSWSKHERAELGFWSIWRLGRRELHFSSTENTGRGLFWIEYERFFLFVAGSTRGFKRWHQRKREVKMQRQTITNQTIIKNDNDQTKWTGDLPKID